MENSTPFPIPCPLHLFHLAVPELHLLCAQSLQSCLTLCNPLDCSMPDASVHGILWARRTLKWIAMSCSKGSSQPRDRTRISVSPPPWPWKVHAVQPPPPRLSLSHWPLCSTYFTDEDTETHRRTGVMIPISKVKHGHILLHGIYLIV